MKKSDNDNVSSSPKTKLPRSQSEEALDTYERSGTYEPLSRLPTPPVGYNSRSILQLSSEALWSSGRLDPSLFVHLKNLIPVSCSRAGPPSVKVILSILTRAGVPRETVALAVCVLDSLSNKFALEYRRALALAAPDPALSLSTPGNRTEPRIEDVHPEIIVLAALIIATEYRSGEDEGNAVSASKCGEAIWSADQIKATICCIMEHCRYGLADFNKKENIDEALSDMEKAGCNSDPAIFGIQFAEHPIPLGDKSAQGNSTPKLQCNTSHGTENEKDQCQEIIVEDLEKFALINEDNCNKDFDKGISRHNEEYNEKEGKTSSEKSNSVSSERRFDPLASQGMSQLANRYNRELADGSARYGYGNQITPMSDPDDDDFPYRRGNDDLDFEPHSEEYMQGFVEPGAYGPGYD